MQAVRKLERETWTTTRELVGPARAAEFIKLVDSEFQRSLDRHHVDLLAQKFASCFEPGIATGVCLAVLADGRTVCLNGHHTSHAIIKIDRTLDLPVTVIRGIDAVRAKQIAIQFDQGKNRDLRAKVRIATGQGGHTSSVALLAYWWDEDTRQAGEGEPRRSAPRIARNRHDDVVAYADLHSSAIAESAAIGNSAYDSSGGIAPSRLFGFLHWLFRQASREAADQFISRLASGAALDATDPIWLLRERLRKMKINTNESLYNAMGLCIRAWNAWVRGDRQTHLKLPTDGFTVDTFPVPILRGVKPR